MKQKAPAAGRDSLARLAGAAKKGDAASFEELCSLFSARVFRLAYYRVRSRMDAEDLTQEILLAAYQGLPRLKDPEKFAPWLFSIAKNRVADHLRKKRISNLIFFNRSREDEEDKQEQTPAGGPDALESTLRREFWEKVDEFSATLSRMEREVFSLRFFSDLGLREMAEVIGKDESTVKTHLYRAVAKFRDREDMREFLRETAEAVSDNKKDGRHDQ